MQAPVIFDTHTTFERFKKVNQVLVNDKKLTIKIEGEAILLKRGKKIYHILLKHNLFARWVTIDGVLHYIRIINGFLGSSKQIQYIKAELA